MFLDGIGCGSGKVDLMLRSDAELFISSLLRKHGKKLRKPEVTAESESYGISPFFIERGNANIYIVENSNLPRFDLSGLS